MTRPFITITLISIMLIALPATGAEPTDSIESRDWWNLLKKGQLNLADTTVIYPRFGLTKLSIPMTQTMSQERGADGKPALSLTTG